MPDLQKPSGASVDFQGKSESNNDFEHGPVEMVDLPIENGGSFHSYLVGGAIAILQNMSSSMGRMTSHILWKIKIHV
jgi:hypothetical protein